jgi:DNA-binding CsgD family transcriptional regulator
MSSLARSGQSSAILNNVDSGTIVELARFSRSVGAFQEALLTAVMQHVEAEVGAFGIGSVVSPATLGFRADVVGDWASIRRRHGAELGPVLAAARAGVAVDAEILGEMRVRSTRYFAEVVRPHGGRETLCALPTWDGAPVGCLWLGRCGPRGRFRRRDVAGVGALLPAIAMASVAMAARRIGPTAGTTLSARESEIVDLLRLGLRSREIAGALGTSTNTVRNQIWRLMARLGAGTRGELIARCGPDDHG